MADDTKTHKPPYVPFTTFRKFLDGLADSGLPSTIDKSLMPTLSGGMQSTLLISLKSTGLIEESGKPTARLERYVLADGEDRKVVLREMLESGFPYFFSGNVDLKRMTPAQFDKTIRDESGVSNSTLDKSASFFLGAIKELGIEISPHLEKRKNAFKRSTKPKAEPKTNRATDEEKSDGAIVDSSPPPQITEKLLEYRLVDLMGEAANEPDVMQAIISVVTWLKTREAKKKGHGMDRTP